VGSVESVLTGCGELKSLLGSSDRSVSISACSVAVALVENDIVAM